MPIRRPSRKRLACEFAGQTRPVAAPCEARRQGSSKGGFDAPLALPANSRRTEKKGRTDRRARVSPSLLPGKKGGLGSRFPDRRGRESDLPAGRRRSRLFVHRLIPGDGMSRLRVCKQTRPAAAQARRQVCRRVGQKTEHAPLRGVLRFLAYPTGFEPATFRVGV